MPKQDILDGIRKAAEIPDDRLESYLAQFRYPNGPEDDLIKKYGYSWDALQEFAANKTWTLSSRLSQCLVEMGALCERVVEEAAFFRLYHERVNPWVEKLKESSDAKQDRMDG